MCVWPAHRVVSLTYSVLATLIVFLLYVIDYQIKLIKHRVTAPITMPSIVSRRLWMIWVFSIYLDDLELSSNKKRVWYFYLTRYIFSSCYPLIALGTCSFGCATRSTVVPTIHLFLPFGVVHCCEMVSVDTRLHIHKRESITLFKICRT